MKKFVAIFVCLILLFSVTVAAEPETEMVVQMIYQEGKYTGQVVGGVPHGYGAFVAVNSEGVQWHYLGEWVNGNMSGQGGKYFDSGESYVGLWEAGVMVCGELHIAPSTNMWCDTRADEQGRVKAKFFRMDGSVYFDGYVDSKTSKPVEGTIYAKDGTILTSGIIGEGFNWNLIY